MLIRDSTIEDVTEFDQIRQAVEPWHVVTVATQRTRFASAPPDAVRLCADDRGRVVGFGYGSFDPYSDLPGAASMAVSVRPEARHRGIGSALTESIEAHLVDHGARVIYADVLDDTGSVTFAERRGYVMGASVGFLVVDPRRLPPLPAVPDRVTVLTAAEAGPERFYSVFRATVQDAPSDVPVRVMPYGDYRDRVWSRIDPRVSMMCLVNGVPAATTELYVNDETGRAESVGSAGLREFRGRGLVKLIKSVSLRAAADVGVTAAYTGNDLTNAPMRAINAWLGYQPVTPISGTRSALKQP